MPGMPPPPARFSTGTPWPHFTARRSATMREKMSAACPGGNGTITRTDFVGYVCAATPVATTNAIAKAAKRMRPPLSANVYAMCRALLYLGEPVLLDNLLFQPDSALVRQSYMPKMLNMLNLAGFGLRPWDPASHAPATPFFYGPPSLPALDRNPKSPPDTVRAG